MDNFIYCYQNVPQPNVGDPTPQPRISNVTTLAQPADEQSIMPVIQGELETVPITGGMDTPQYEDICVRWNSYQTNMQAVFPILLSNELFVDVTLGCEGKSIKCHKVILSACSTYFEQLLTQNPCQHPIILMKDLRFWEVQALVEFMYRGEVNIAEANLPNLLAAANALKIKGLAGSSILHKESFSNGNSSPLHSPRDEQQCAAPTEVSTTNMAPVNTAGSTPLHTPGSPRTTDHGRAFYRRIRKHRSESPLTTTINPPPLQPCPRQQNISVPPSYYYQYDSLLNNSGTQFMGLPSSTYKTEQDDMPPSKRRAQSPEMTIDPMMIKTEPVDIDDYADENIYNSNDSMDPLGNFESEEQDDEINPDEQQDEYSETTNILNEADDTERENSSESSKGLTPETEMDVGGEANDGDED